MLQLVRSVNIESREFGTFAAGSKRGFLACAPVAASVAFFDDFAWPAAEP